MPDSNPMTLPAASAPAVRYVAFLGDRLERGSAEEILRSIQQHAPAESSLRKRDLDEYARLLIKDADYFIPKGILDFLEQQAYPTAYDKALVYLSYMQSSQVRILSKEAA